jgi:hypothetical protein
MTHRWPRLIGAAESNRRNIRQRGSILPIVSVLAATVIAFLGLAVDASYLYYEKRRVQTAADAGAMAGAQELLRGNTSSVTAAARKDTSLNRYTHGSDNVVVTVNNPPASGPKVGNSSFVEVIVSRPRPTWFMRVMGVSSAEVRARAVAGLANSAGCVYALNRDTSNSNNGVFVNGTTSSVFACAVFSNANFRSTGGSCIVAPQASYSGTYSNSNGSDPNCGPASLGHGLPVADPIASRYTIPATSPCAYNNYKQTSGAAITLSPGIYCGGIEIGGSVPSVTFSPGTYVLVGGGMRIGSGVSATGIGVTFFNTYPGTQMNKYDGIKIDTSGTVNFSAPTSGAYKALLFYQDPRVEWASNNGSTLTPGTSGTFEGIIYFPTTDLTYSGSSSTSLSGGYTILVAYNFKISGNAQINMDFSSIGGSNPLQMAAFAE